MTEQDKQSLIEYYCQRDCGHTREECCLDNCHEIMLIEEFPTTSTDTDTISRQAAIDEIDEWIKAFRENGHKQSAADARLIQDGIIKLSSAQPEIIRCKDCKHYGRADKRRFYRGYDCLDGRIASIVPDKDFCSRAERREVTT